jgi:hypothetical protein
MGSLSLCDVFGCDLKFGLPQSKSRDLRQDRFRQFPVASRFDTVWAACSRSVFTTRVRFGLRSPSTVQFVGQVGVALLSALRHRTIKVDFVQ